MSEPFRDMAGNGESPKDFNNNEGHVDPIFSSAPAVLTTTGGGKIAIDTAAWLQGESTASAAATTSSTSIMSKGSKNVMKKILKTANMANPLQFIPKTPRSSNISPENDDSSKSKKSFWKMGQNRSQQQLVTDESEDAVLATVEERFANTRTGEDGFRPAVAGEKPPLNVPTLGNALLPPPSLKRDSSNGSKSYTQRMLGLQRQKSYAIRSLEKAQHRRAKTLLTSLEGNISRRGDDYFGIAAEDDHFKDFDKIYDDNTATNTAGFGGDDEDGENDTDDDGKSEDDLEAAMEEWNSDEDLAGEKLPLLRRNSSGRKQTERQLKAKRVLKKNQLKRIRELLNPQRILKNLGSYILHSTLFVSIWFFTIAWILYYYCGNPPPPDFLPGTARLSWWCNFVGRQLLMFELARLWQLLFIDCFVLAFRFVSHFLGPWVTIYCIQSKGWPFVVFSWGLLDMLLLHGDGLFQQHWFYWTGIQIYQSANSGSWILASENYLRILLCMLVAGVLTTLKRTVVSLYFGRRMFDMYRQRLDNILSEVIMISEIAELSFESDSILNVLGIHPKNSKEEQLPPSDVAIHPPARPRTNSVRWSETQVDEENVSQLGSDLGHAESGPEEKIDVEEETYSEHMTYSFDELAAAEERNGFYDSSSHLPMMDLLDKWDDPANKREKSYDASVNDIMKFRRALTYMDPDFPFSESFGKASTRAEMVQSAELVYMRLLKLAPDTNVLPCSVFQILYLNEDGTEDKAQKRSFGNLLQPDFQDNIPLLSFVQSCDTVYKKLRYFRASVGNSSVIDHVLENIIDGVFYFALGLILLDLLKLNPWPLLVSTSTLLVAGSFAVGPSCAKAVEGILLIVGRRPYDIGDRIVITDSPGGQIPSMTVSWIVEDISLFSTTLRFGSSNEIATVSNGSIAGARITNCARSKNAIAHCMLKFHISCQKDPETMVRYRKNIEMYIREKTHIWENIFFFRCEDVDSDLECVTFHLAVRSRYTWQVSNRVLQFQGDLNQFCVSLAYKFHIQYDSPNARTVTYYGGSLVDGGIKKYKTKILERSNIRNDSEIIAGMLPSDVVRQLSGQSFDSGSEIVSTSPLADLATQKLPTKTEEEETANAKDEKLATAAAAEETVRFQDAMPTEESVDLDLGATKRSSTDDRFLSMLHESQAS